MHEFCPLCRKDGCSSKIVAVQLNFHEAVYLCESEKCHWPYGYEEFKIIPRSIEGLEKSSSKKSIVKSNVEKSKGGIQPIPISTELSLYTPPVTPSNDVSLSKEAVKGTTPHSVLNDDISQSTTVIKYENTTPAVPSIFDIDSSVSLPAKKVGKVQNKTGKLCDIRNENKKKIKSEKLSDRRSGTTSNRLPLKKSPQIRSIESSNININCIKIESKTKLSQPSIKLEADNPNNEMKQEKHSSDDVKQIIVMEKSPKKLSSDISLTNSTSIIKNSNENLSIHDDEESHALITTQCEEIYVKVSKGSSIVGNNFVANNLVFDSDNAGNININDFFEETFLDDIPNNSQEIDDVWLQSLLM